MFKDENLLPSMIYQVQHHTHINNQYWLLSSACAVEVFIARAVQIIVKSLQTRVPPIHSMGVVIPVLQIKEHKTRRK